MKVCKIEGCENKFYAKGLCNKHWQKNNRDNGNGKLVRRRYALTEKGKTSKKKSDKRYALTEGGKKSHQKACKKQRDKFPDKIKARSLAYSYIKQIVCGVKNCTVLGERHHPDYLEPLNVLSLCSKHHNEEHRRLENL